MSGEKKTKKQHYVPRCYLENWAIPGKYQVYVFDSEHNSKRINNINDIASERFFYDVDPKEVFSEEMLSKLKEAGLPCDIVGQSQGIEHTFANEVEGPFKIALQKLVEKSNEAGPWIIKNCYFMMPDEKSELSAYLAIQYIRTKRFRRNIEAISGCLEKAMKDLGAYEEVIKQYTLPEKDSKNVQAQMLMDYDALVRIALSFVKLTWILCINRTDCKLYTSDNPIVSKAHIKHPYMSMAGLNSKGVEFFFPISPTCILVMFDGSCLLPGMRMDRKYVEITEKDNIDYYNSLLALNCDSCVYSQDGDWRLLEEMERETPGIFQQPHIQLQWGGKTYTGM